MSRCKKIKTSFWILKHKWYVFWYILKACKTLLIRGLKHDLSKFSKEEFEYVYILSTKGKNIKFGTKDYYDLVDCCIPAKIAHATRNRHHPEFYFNDINKMSPIDLIEMMADWSAATKRNNGNFKNSLKINKKKYGINKNLEDSIIRDAKEIGLWNF